LRMNMMISYQELVRTFPKSREDIAKGFKYSFKRISATELGLAFIVVMATSHSSILEHFIFSDNFIAKQKSAFIL
ncbi:MAG: hypothetical protein Q4Q00_14255, partial [Turicibacter sp.]|nr:hypothetical protein [Turicibacter sp.]